MDSFSTSYDAEANSAYLKVKDGQVDRTEVVIEGKLMADVDANGELVGIEVIFGSGVVEEAVEDVTP
jgi:uncharacterized protein YuzE